MADTLTPKKRSWNMSRIKSRGTLPENKLYQLFKRAGFKIRRNAKELPGSPDILLVRRKTAVFLHGCFWHRHKGCKFSYIPKSNIVFWKNKFAANQDRDAVVSRKLRALGYSIVIVWECQLKSPGFSLKDLPCLSQRKTSTRI